MHLDEDDDKSARPTRPQPMDDFKFAPSSANEANAGPEGRTDGMRGRLGALLIIASVGFGFLATFAWIVALAWLLIYAARALF
jgi:hypothetical protein